MKKTTAQPADYFPTPIDTSEVELTSELLNLTEQLAKNTHDVWAAGRFSQGWAYGRERNDELKTTPLLVPYEDLEEEEKEYDRQTAMQTIKLIISKGFRILPPAKS